MNKLLTTLPALLLWGVFGALASLFNFWLLERNTNSLLSAKSTALKALPGFLLGRLLRLVLLSLLLYFSVTRQGAFGAISLALGYSLARLAQVILFNRKSSPVLQQSQSSDAEKTDNTPDKETEL